MPEIIAEGKGTPQRILEELQRNNKETRREARAAIVLSLVAIGVAIIGVFIH